MLDDSPLEVSTPSGLWRPANYDKTFHGLVRVRDALERSLNVATARLAQEVGASRVADVAARLGIESPLPPVPSLALGSADISPLELARAYATIGNGGIRPQIRTFEDVVDGSGRAVERQPIGFERVLDAGTASLATSLLEGVIDRGTGAGVREEAIGARSQARRTSDEAGRLVRGILAGLVVVVWIGFDGPAVSAFHPAGWPSPSGPASCVRRPAGSFAVHFFALQRWSRRNRSALRGPGLAGCPRALRSSFAAPTGDDLPGVGVAGASRVRPASGGRTSWSASSKIG
jgi:membrane peptidoglycan carboxypeptidase